MPGHKGGMMPQKKKPAKKKPNGKNGLTAKQKTLPKFLQDKILKSKKKTKTKTKHPGRR